MFFFYHPLRIVFGSLIWLALSTVLAWLMLLHPPRHEHSAGSLTVLAISVGIMLWAAWTAWTSLRWMWASVQTYYRAGR